jgi:hypothetical protein
MYSLSSGFKVCSYVFNHQHLVLSSVLSHTHTDCIQYTVYSIQYTVYSIQHTTEEEGTHTNHGRSKATVYGHGHVIVMCICLLDYKRIREDDGRGMIEGIRRRDREVRSIRDREVGGIKDREVGCIRDREVGSIRDRENSKLENKQKQNTCLRNFCSAFFINHDIFIFSMCGHCQAY